MNKKSLRIIVALVFIVLTITACDKNDVNKEKTNKETDIQEQVEKSGLQRFFEDDKWQDEWAVTNDNGEDVIISIDADIVLPDSDTMSVIETENILLTNDNKEIFIKKLFDENSAFYNDEKHMTKEQWQKKIDREIQDEIDGYELDMIVYKDENLRETYEESLQMLYDKKADYENKMNGAPEEYTNATDFDCDFYVGNIDGKSYTMNFTKTGYGENEPGTKTDCIKIESSDYIKPIQLENAVYVYKLEDSTVHDELKAENNNCQMTKEEAKRYAQNYLNAAGIPNAVCTYAEDLCWKGNMQNSDKPTEVETVHVLDGYKLIFTAGVDDIPLQYIENEEGYGDDYYDKMQKFNVHSMETKVTLEINDYGLISMEIINPIKINNVIGDVELLPLSDVYKIIKDSINNRPDDYGNVAGKWAKSDMTYNQMELTYFRVTDRNEENKYSYVPVWRLTVAKEEPTGGTCKSILVNAIDGTVIDIIDELSSGGCAQQENP